MTLKARNSLVITFFSLVCLVALTLIIMIIVIDISPASLDTLNTQITGRYILSSWAPQHNIFLETYIASILGVLLSLGTGIVFLYNYRRISSPQLFFVVLFWLCLAFESLRFIGLFSHVADWGISFRTFISKLYASGRLFATLSLFAASLYDTGMKFRYQWMVLGFITLVGVAFPFLVPVDVTQMNQHFLYPQSHEFNLGTFRLLVTFLALLNFGRTAFKSKETWDPKYLLLMLGLFVGNELLAASFHWMWTLAAMIIIVVATAFINRRYVENYLWY